MATHGWNALFCLAFRQGRAVIKNSVFCWLPLNVCQHFYFIVCGIPATGYWMSLFFSSWYILLCPIGGDCGSEEGGEWSGPGLPVTSSDRNWRRPAQHWNHPVLFESKWIIRTSCNSQSAPMFLSEIIIMQGPVLSLIALLVTQLLGYCIMTFQSSL